MTICKHELDIRMLCDVGQEAWNKMRLEYSRRREQRSTMKSVFGFDAWHDISDLLKVQSSTGDQLVLRSVSEIPSAA
jgi:hypothetical protein